MFETKYTYSYETFYLLMADQIEQLGIKIKTQQKDFEELQTQFNVQVEECSNLSNKLESTQLYYN